jgi:carboxylesterase
MNTLGSILRQGRMRKTIAALILIMLSGAAYAGVASWMLRREIARTPRDAATGIIQGAEARDLDPPWFDLRRSQDRPTTACLLIHGWAGTPRDFGDLPERLAGRGYHVRVMLLPGHGTTPQEFGQQTPETLYAAVEREFRALQAQYQAVDVVGFSMGGTLATRLASREPVRRLVLAAPYYSVSYKWYYVLPPEAWNAAISPFITYVVKAPGFVKVNRREALGEIITYHVLPTSSVRMLIALGRQARRPEVLGAIHCPTLLVISQGDGAASPRAAKKAFAGLGSSDKKFIPISARSNHHLFWDYDREEVKTAVVDFLAKGKGMP